MEAIEPPARLLETPTVRIRPSRGLMRLRLHEVWEYRELLCFLVWRDIKIRYKQTAFGVGWALLQPLFSMIVFTVFFGLLAKIPSEGLPYPIFYYSALLPWTYFASALGNATNTMVDHRHVITKVYFPRLILPLSAVLSPLLDFVIAFMFLIAMMGYYRITPRNVWLLPVFLLLAMATALGVGLWLSALNAVYRDVRHAVPFLIQVWMFASPVVYSSVLLPERWRSLYSLNPMAGVIEGFRWTLVGGGQPPTLSLFISCGVVALVLIGGLVYFRRMECTITDVV